MTLREWEQAMDIELMYTLQSGKPT